MSDWLVDSTGVPFAMQAPTATSAVSKPIPFVSLTILFQFEFFPECFVSYPCGIRIVFCVLKRRFECHCVIAPAIVCAD